MSSASEDAQRLDLWLWCARFRKVRADCARLIGEGAVRLNRRPVEKPATRIRAGDVLTVALGGGIRPDGAVGGTVRVVRVLALAARRGPASEARALYEEIEAGVGSAEPCNTPKEAAYPAPRHPSTTGGSGPGES